MIYLDYNATAPLLPTVKTAMFDAMDTVGNPSSVHRFGIAVKQQLNKSRQVLASYINAAPQHIVFTGSGTEANALALSQAPNILVEATAHPSIINHPNVHKTIAVNGDGFIKLEDLTQQIATIEHPFIVSVMAANNETGVIQGVGAIRKIVHTAGGLLHVDASQTIGRTPIDFLNSQVDFMTICFHKSGGPIGIAALVVHDIDNLKPLFYGGAQEQRRRAGTENMPAIAGVEAYCNNIHFPDISLQEKLEEALAEYIIARDTTKIPNTLCVFMPGVKAETQVMAFDLEGIAISAGSACSSGKVAASHVLTAMQHPQAANAIRVSWGWQTTAAEIEQFIMTWHKIYQRCKNALR